MTKLYRLSEGICLIHLLPPKVMDRRLGSAFGVEFGVPSNFAHILCVCFYCRKQNQLHKHFSNSFQAHRK